MAVQIVVISRGETKEVSYAAMPLTALAFMYSVSVRSNFLIMQPWPVWLSCLEHHSVD